MTRLTPVSRRELIRRLRFLGFIGPYSGGKHQYMTRNEITIAIPNPHRQKISADLLLRILRQAGITREEWMKIE